MVEQQGKEQVSETRSSSLPAVEGTLGSRKESPGQDTCLSSQRFSAGAQIQHGGRSRRHTCGQRWGHGEKPEQKAQVICLLKIAFKILLKYLTCRGERATEIATMNKCLNIPDDSDGPCQLRVLWQVRGPNNNFETSAVPLSWIGELQLHTSEHLRPTAVTMLPHLGTQHSAKFRFVVVRVLNQTTQKLCHGIALLSPT